MFHSTRIKLTAWYLMVVMLVSGMFSVLIYWQVSQEMERGFKRAQKSLIETEIFKEEGLRGLARTFHMEHMLGKDLENAPLFMFVNDLEAAKHKLFASLLIVNGVIALLAAWASFVFAGKSLEPIAAAMEEQKRFISDASHELRTPVAALRTALEVNLGDKKLSKYAVKLMKENLTDVKNLERLVTGLLRLSRSNGTLNGESVDVDIVQEIKQAVRTVKPLAKKKNIAIKTSLGKKKLLVRGSENSLQELVMILLDNAVKYSSIGKKVFVSINSKGKRVELKVRDEGVGITKKNLPHIFDRFYRVDDARCKDVEGFGLGLALAKKIVDQHEGEISVKSKMGKGSEFVVELPIS